MKFLDLVRRRRPQTCAHCTLNLRSAIYATIVTGTAPTCTDNEMSHQWKTTD